MRCTGVTGTPATRDLATNARWKFLGSTGVPTSTWERSHRPEADAWTATVKEQGGQEAESSIRVEVSYDLPNGQQ